MGEEFFRDIWRSNVGEDAIVAQDTVSSMFFKVKQMVIQEGIHKYGDDGSKSAMNKMSNLTSNDCFGAQIAKGLKGLVLGILHNNICQDAAVITGVVEVNGNNNGNNNNDNDAAPDDVLHANDGGMDTLHTGVLGNMEVHTLDDDTLSIGVGSEEMHLLKLYDRNAERMPSLAIDQCQLCVEEIGWFTNANMATNADAGGDVVNVDAKANANTNADASANVATNANGDANAIANTNADTDANANTNADASANAATNANANGDANAVAGANAGANATNDDTNANANDSAATTDTNVNMNATNVDATTDGGDTEDDDVSIWYVINKEERHWEF